VGKKIWISVNQFPAERPQEEKWRLWLNIELTTAEWEVLSSNPGQGEKLFFISFFISSVILHGTVIPEEIFPSFTWKNCIPEEIFHANQDLVPALTIQTFFQCEEGKKKEQ